MGKCCKCEEHGWPDPQEVVFSDLSGNGYCVWHAPKKQKGLSEEGFNILVRERILEVNEKKTRGWEKAWCDFSGVVFPGDISFAGLCETRELPGVVFEKAYFCGDTSFEMITITGDANFSNASFAGKAKFMGATFSREAFFWFSEFNETADFDQAKFQCLANFSNVMFGKSALFWNTEFHDSADFRGAWLTDFTVFSTCKAKPRAILLHGLSQEAVQTLIFTPLELPSLSFLDCQWPWALRARTSEELYRAMKQRAAEEHDQPQVSRWHFCEKFTQLRRLFNNDRSNNLLEEVEDRDAKWPARTKAWFKLLWHRPHWPKLTLTGLYWATSGFGERAVRAGVWLLALVVLSFVANSIKEPWVWAELPGSAAAQYTMATIPFAKDIPGEGWVKFGRGVWQFLIAVQFTLFALAVRNRFRR